MDEALPEPGRRGESEIEIRQVFDADDFGDNLPPEEREREDRLRDQIEQQQKK